MRVKTNANMVMTIQGSRSFSIRRWTMMDLESSTKLKGECKMNKLITTDMRISKIISSLSEPTSIALKDNPTACHVVFEEVRHIILEECDFFSHIVDLKIIEKNDKIKGNYSTEDNLVKLVIEDETNMSILNTMAHELRHAFQHYNGWLRKSFIQKDNHSKVVEDYMYNLEDFDTTEEHVRQVLYRTSWHEIDAQRYARWFTKGGLGEFKETEFFDINEHNIGKELISQLLRMGKQE